MPRCPCQVLCPCVAQSIPRVPGVQSPSAAEPVAEARDEAEPQLCPFPISGAAKP